MSTLKRFGPGPTSYTFVTFRSLIWFGFTLGQESRYPSGHQPLEEWPSVNNATRTGALIFWLPTLSR